MHLLQINTKTSSSEYLLIAKLCLVFALLIFFIPLFILPFYNHPCTDDYFCGVYLNQLGFNGYQQYIYNENGGRFAATLTGSLFAENGFLYRTYYIHTLLLLIFNFFSIYLLLKTFTRYVLNHEIGSMQAVLFSLVFYALAICSIPEPSTFLFWFSSAVTYQLPVILIQAEITLLIIFCNTTSKMLHFIAALIIPLLIFFINGFNELFIIIQAIIMLSTFYADTKKRISKLLWVFIALAFFGSLLLVVTAPGNQVRAARIDAKSVWVALTAIAYGIGEIIWNILKTPLSWFAGVTSFLYGNIQKNKFADTFFLKLFNTRKWFFPASVICFCIATIAPGVIALKGGLLPERYLNGVSYFVLILLMLYAFTAGATASFNFYNQPFSKLKMYNAVCIILAAGILCNTTVINTFKSLVAAPLYSSIITEREAALKNGTGKTVIIPAYNKALEQHLQKDYNQSVKTLYQLVQQKPSMLFFEDDLSNIYTTDILKRYYRLDSIVIKTE